MGVFVLNHQMLGKNLSKHMFMVRGLRRGKLTPLPLMKEVFMTKEKQMNFENPQTNHVSGQNAAPNLTVNLSCINKHILNALKIISELK